MDYMCLLIHEAVSAREIENVVNMKSKAGAIAAWPGTKRTCSHYSR